MRSSALAFMAAALTLATPAHADLPNAAAIARNSPTGNYLAARLAGNERDMAAAAAYYRAALRADPKNNELIERTFLVVLANGAVEDSIPLAERLVGIDKTHRIARLTLAARALNRGQYPAARAQLAQTVRSPIADLTATLLTAWTYASANEVKTGVDMIDRLRGAEWYTAFKELHAGLLLDLAGQRKEAGKRFERAWRADPTSIRTVDAYGRWAARVGERDKALEIYGSFAKLLPHHPLVDAALAEINAGRTPAPMVRSPAAGAAEVLYGLGSALGRQGGEDLGLIYLQLAIYLDPEHPLALLSLADLYEQMKKPEFALEAYARMPANSPLKRNAEIQRGLTLDALDRTDEARKYLEKLVVTYPDDFDVMVALANVLRTRKHYQEAAEIYGKAIARIEKPARQHWTIFYSRGICYERTKDWPAAERDLEKALELYPDQPQVLNYLGYSWIDRGLNLDRGTQMVRRAVELKPNDGYIVDSLGWAYFRLGLYDQAAKELERAIELRPEDPVINDHLGDAYWKVDRRLEAQFQWRHARDMKPEAEDLVKIDDKLKNGLGEEPAKAGAVRNSGNGG
jgi:tetratricopeptide (TPR) repeat protein